MYICPVKEYDDYLHYKTKIVLQYLWTINVLPLTYSIIVYVLFCRAQDEQHAHEVARFQEELAEAHLQLQILQKQLDEELARQPLTNQEVRNSGWTELFSWWW